MSVYVEWWRVDNHVQTTGWLSSRIWRRPSRYLAYIILNATHTSGSRDHAHRDGVSGILSAWGGGLRVQRRHYRLGQSTID